MRVVHLMASPFFGGPERQVLGLARHLPKEVESAFVTFAERGLAQAFLAEVAKHGFSTRTLTHNTPRFFACVSEVADELRRWQANLLCTSGYKPDIIGWRAARRVGIPIVAISHGWTAATWKVRCYEALDRWAMRRVDAVVSVSNAQADKVRAAGVAEDKVITIHNGVDEEAFAEANGETRSEMLRWFTAPPRWLIGAAGRMSPEKGFHVLIEAAALVAKERPEAGFVHFGDGPLRADLERLRDERSLQSRFVFAGFRDDVRRFLPNLDVGVMSSFTEGLPVILLETSAAAVPTVATSVGGIPEVIDDGRTGYVVRAGDATALARRLIMLLDNDAERVAMGRAARDRVRRDFTFAAMADRYHALFRKLLGVSS